jgi:energy-coupling factor transporter ATP-binding protein EcfA2
MRGTTMFMKRGVFIYFLGPEGGGKSTQINILKRLFKNIGMKKVHYAPKLRTRNVVMRLLFKRFIPEYFSSASSAGTWRGASKRELKLYPLLFLFEVFTTIAVALFSAYIFYLMGYLVVCEDYLIDVVCDLERDHVRFGLKRIFFIIALNVLLRLVPSNDTILIFLNADYDVLKKRYLMRNGKIEPFDYISVRVSRSLYYFNLYKRRYYIDNSNLSIEETSRLIIDVLQKEGVLRRGGWK